MSGHLITNYPDNGADEGMPLGPYGGITVTIDVIEPKGTIL